MTDNGMTFEKVVAKFWGQSDTTIYFANYWTDLNVVNKILYGICFKERYCTPKKQYSMEILETFDKYLNLLSEKNESVKSESLTTDISLYVEILTLLESI